MSSCFLLLLSLFFSPVILQHIMCFSIMVSTSKKQKRDWTSLLDLSIHQVREGFCIYGLLFGSIYSSLVFFRPSREDCFFFFFFTEMCMINAVVFPSQQLMLCQPSSIFVIKWEQRLKPSYLPLSTAFVQVSLKFPLHIDCHVSLQLYILPVHTSAIVFLAERLLSFSPKYLVPSMVQNGSSIDLQLTGSYSSSPNWQWFLQQSVCRTFQETGNHHYPMVYILYLFSFLSFLT